MTTDIDPSETLQRLLRGWWLVVVLMLAGAAAGLAAAQLLPPTYEARAEYHVGLDETLFAIEHQLETVTYTDRKDQLSAVSDIFYGEEVIAEVEDRAAEGGISLPQVPFWRYFRLDRFYTSWVLSVRHTDPGLASELVNIWVGAADRAVQEAYQHALSANRLGLEMAGIQVCFSTGDLAAGNSCAGSFVSSVADLTAYVEDLATRQQAEWEASRGLSYASRLELVGLAELPIEPSRNQAGILTLSGALLGWLAGLVLVVRRPGGGRMV